MVNGLFVDRRNERALNDVYERFARLRVPYREIAYRGKQLVLRVSMASELNVLAHRLNRFSERNRHYRDFTLNSLSQAMREIIACFPVYRTYVNEREPEVSEQDRHAIERAVREAKRRNPNRPAAVYDFVRDLLLKKADYIPDAERDEHLQLRRQVPAGDQPGDRQGHRGHRALHLQPPGLAQRGRRRTRSLRHRAASGSMPGWRERAARWPHGLSATSTHDTKRSEDVRARLNVLSELPGAWKQATSRWARIEPARPDDHRRPVVSEPQRGVPPLPDAARHLAARADGRRRSERDYRDAHRRLHAQGDARSEGVHQLDQSERARTSRR